MNYQLETIVSQPFEQNSTILWRKDSTDAIVFDPGMEPELILESLAINGLTLVAVMLTHGHSDHIAGNAAMKQHFPDAPILIGTGDAPLLLDPWLNLSGFFGTPLTSPPADRLVIDGEILTIAGVTFEVREIPGHSPGHVVYCVNDTSPPIIIGGDVLFRGGIGRTDFPGGSLKTLLHGIDIKLRPLPENSIIYPGHGPVTTLGHEWRTNQFLKLTS